MSPLGWGQVGWKCFGVFLKGDEIRLLVDWWVLPSLPQCHSLKEKLRMIFKALVNKKKKVKSKVLVTQLCPTLCDPMDYSPPGFSVHEILQARILERVAMLSPRGSSQFRD